VSSCPNDCSGNGICRVNNQCICSHFFYGEDCSKKRECNANEAALCSSISPPVSSSSSPKDYSNILRNVGSFVGTVNLDQAPPKPTQILKGENLNFVGVNADKEVSIIASSGVNANPAPSSPATAELPKLTTDLQQINPSLSLKQNEAFRIASTFVIILSLMNICLF
jgi:hypothetical protein